jgi:MinD superfamily P-loop ATPase
MKIAIASGKGGTGKTTLATNLASFLAEETRVVLADMDVEEPNSGLFLKMKKTGTIVKYKMIPDWIKGNCTYCGECTANCNFNAILKLPEMIMVFPELCHSCFACAELCKFNALAMIPKRIGEINHFQQHNLDFIESRLDIGVEQAVPLISQTQTYLDQHFGDDTIILIDAPPGTSCPVIEVTREAGFVILVTEPTPFGLHDLKLSVRTMKQLKKDIGVVINRHSTGQSIIEDYCISNKINILGKIPYSRKIAEIYSNGKLIYKDLPEVRSLLYQVAENIGIYNKIEKQ